jgi:DNA/RNA-binding domain of Phe-tRNA-synthetase-like protein
MLPRVRLSVSSHPLLELGAFVTELPSPLAQLPSPDWLRELLLSTATAPLAADDAVRAAVRDMLRVRGYKPTGRGKPASEYLGRAAGDGALGSINLAVDACNAVSLHAGLPISVVDLGRVAEPLRVTVAGAGDSYVFNAGGQEIELAGLPCLYDIVGACANAVKDAQRTKTSPATRRTLSLVWGARALGDRTARTVEWYRALLSRAGAETTPVVLEETP